jgi:hypothetical protein
LCLTGDRGRCQNAGEERPRLRAARAEDLAYRDRWPPGEFARKQGDGSAQPLSDGFGPLVGHKEPALLSDEKGQWHRPTGELEALSPHT